MYLWDIVGQPAIIFFFIAIFFPILDLFKGGFCFLGMFESGEKRIGLPAPLAQALVRGTVGFFKSHFQKQEKIFPIFLQQ